MKTSYEVRIQGMRMHRGARGSTYQLRWVVAKRRFGKSFTTKALAESFRAQLLLAQRSGVAFDLESGLPEPEARKRNSRNWLEHAMDFVDVKWPHWAPKHRHNTADALTTVTMALMPADRRRPPDAGLRVALTSWAFNASARDSWAKGAPFENVPPVHETSIAWLMANAIAIEDMDDAVTIRRVLDGLTIRLDGAKASVSTVRRKRTTFSSTLKYAVELRLLSSSPLSHVTWQMPRSEEFIDRRVVANPQQVKLLIAAVGEISHELQAFFGCMYYSSMRPEEVRFLRTSDYESPATSGGWGWFHLSGATVEVPEEWGDHEGGNEDRELKHRPKTATRSVPVPPQLVRLLDDHLARHSPGDGGRIFVSRKGPGGRFVQSPGRPVTSSTYSRVWKLARIKALPKDLQSTPLAAKPYHLRHAGVSFWLNAGVPATQVAEWAGHSVNVLLRVYAKCIDGEQDAAMRRIEAAFLQAETSAGADEGGALGAGDG